MDTETELFFIHIPKCAGISIAMAAPQAITGEHRSCRQYYELYGRRFSAAFKFTSVRHPYARLVSAYAYLLSQTPEHQNWATDDWQREHLQKFPSLEDAVLDSGPRRVCDLFLLQPQVYWIEGFFPDYVMRFERLAKDWKLLQARFGFADLPHANASSHKPWTQIVTQPMRAKLREWYKDDFKFFGYVP